MAGNTKTMKDLLAEYYAGGGEGVADENIKFGVSKEALLDFAKKKLESNPHQTKDEILEELNKFDKNKDGLLSVADIPEITIDGKKLDLKTDKLKNKAIDIEQLSDVISRLSGEENVLKIQSVLLDAADNHAANSTGKENDGIITQEEWAVIQNMPREQLAQIPAVRQLSVSMGKQIYDLVKTVPQSSEQTQAGVPATKGMNSSENTTENKPAEAASTDAATTPDTSETTSSSPQNLGEFFRKNPNAGGAIGLGLGLFFAMFGGSWLVALLLPLIGSYFIDGEKGILGDVVKNAWGGDGGKSGGAGASGDYSEKGAEAAQGNTMEDVWQRKPAAPSQYHKITDGEKDVGTVALSINSKNEFIDTQEAGQLVLRGKILENGNVQITETAAVGADRALGAFYNLGDKSVIIPANNGVIDANSSEFRKVLKTAEYRIKYENNSFARQQAIAAKPVPLISENVSKTPEIPEGCYRTPNTSTGISCPMK